MYIITKFIKLPILVILLGCTPSRENSTADSKSTKIEEPSKGTSSYDGYLQEIDHKPIGGQDFYHIDLNQSLDGKSLAELRLLRNSLMARQGYIFMKADLRGFFSKYMWYDSLMYERWEREDAGAEVPLELSLEEKAFIQKIKEKEEVLLAQNYISHKGYQYANVNNIVNTFQFENLESSFLQQIGKNGFAIVPNTHIQLFHLYEKNDYQQVPNFVTTDLFLQLYHMYFSFLLRSLEEDIFYARMTTFVQAMYAQAIIDYQNAKKGSFKANAGFSVVFFQVANRILSGVHEKLPAELAPIAEQEFSKINAAQDDLSPFLGYDPITFPYSLFKPRGHYTRSEKLKNYFKAMMWLQKGELCLDQTDSFENAIYMAMLMKKSSINNTPVIRIFESVYDPIKYFIGEPDNISIYDLIQDSEVKTKSYSELDRGALKKRLLALGRNKIKPKEQNSCLNKVNLFPQRYIFDNDILQNLVDTKSKSTKRAYPKGIDVFGVLGVTEAEELLNQFYKEGTHWEEYDSNFQKLRDRVDDRPVTSVYSKWVQCLVDMQQQKEDAPSFMNLPLWRRKELNTALASWAELKHDAILYAEQPFAAECGGGGPPDPICVGYVEPNIPFWKSINALIKSTNQVLVDNSLYNGEIEAKSSRITELGAFLLQVSEKEIKGQKLTDSEYKTIEIIGSTVEYITLSLLPHWVDNWSLVKGPDREVSVVADIYTANASNNPNKGVLHVGVGPVNDIYVVVEIEGLLYLTRGATFSYYEFVESMDSRLTDEEWQERIKQGKLPAIPKWMEEIIYQKNPPQPDEKIFYSSGC